eukprot:3776069-Prymnesium_polylepis.1
MPCAPGGGAAVSATSGPCYSCGGAVAEVQRRRCRGGGAWRRCVGARWHLVERAAQDDAVPLERDLRRTPRAPTLEPPRCSSLPSLLSPLSSLLSPLPPYGCLPPSPSLPLGAPSLRLERR